MGSFTSQVGNEQGQANADGGQKCCPVLLRRQHVDGKDELRGQDHFNEEAPYNRCAGGQCCAHEKREGEHARHHASCCNSCEYLSDYEQDTFQPPDCSN